MIALVYSVGSVGSVGSVLASLDFSCIPWFSVVLAAYLVSIYFRAEYTLMPDLIKSSCTVS